MPGPASVPGQLRGACLALVLVAAPAVSAQPSLVSQAKATAATAADKVLHGTQDLAVHALGLLGVSYRLGGESPDTGLDCSGLVRHVFRQVSGVTLPRTSRELARMGHAVARNDLVPGDLVFFNTRRSAFSHVGIYLGDSRFIHAPRRGREVEIAELDKAYWRRAFDGARRLASVLPAPTTTAVAETFPPADEGATLEAADTP
jgi:cell wall-associated NlpC family hydrolase